MKYLFLEVVKVIGKNKIIIQRVIKSGKILVIKGDGGLYEIDLLELYWVFLFFVVLCDV